MQSDGYDVDRIYTGGAKDAQGHSINLRLHVPDMFAAQIQELVDSKTIWPEYTSQQVFLRDAVYHRLQWAHNQSHRAGAATARWRKVMQMEFWLNAQDAERAAYRRVRDKMWKICRDAEVDGDREALAGAIDALKEQVESFPDPHFREKLETDLELWEKKLGGITGPGGYRQF